MEVLSMVKTLSLGYNRRNEAPVTFESWSVFRGHPKLRSRKRVNDTGIKSGGLRLKVSRVERKLQTVGSLK